MGLFSYTGYNDRRRFQRLDLTFSVIYRVLRPLETRIRFGDIETEATTLDIGSGGMALLTDRSIPISTILHLRFCLFRMDRFGNTIVYRPLQVNAQVRSKFTHEKGYRLGVTFLKKDSDTREELIELTRCVNS